MKDVTNATTAQECMEIAELNYNLQLQPISIAGTNLVDGIPVQGKQVTGKSAVVRTDNGNPIGVVGKRYEIVQNAEVFSFFDGIVEQGLGKFKEAIATNGGAKVSVVCDLGPMKVGTEDHRKHLILRTSHDGSCSVTGIMRVFRLICSNGLMAIHKQSQVKIRHSRNYQAKMVQAHTTLGVAQQYYEWFQAKANDMFYRDISHNQAWDIIKKELMPPKDEDKVSTKMSNAWGDIYARFVSGRGNNGKTYWDLYNGVTEHVDHYRSRNRNEEQEFESNTVGSGAKLKEKAFAVLTR